MSSVLDTRRPFPPFLACAVPFVAMSVNAPGRLAPGLICLGLSLGSYARSRSR